MEILVDTRDVPNNLFGVQSGAGYAKGLIELRIDL